MSEELVASSTDIHIARFRLDEPFDGAIDLLDRAERTRAERFVFDCDRRRFIAAHAWLHVTLGQYLGRAPKSLLFGADEHERPRLLNADIPFDVRFSLSHAGERALLAIAVGRHVGIDIEKERPVDVLELARRFFSAKETEALQALAPADRRSAFFRCWTRKEAFIKALGTGLRFPLDSFEVSVHDDRAPQLLRECTTTREAMERWRIVAVAAEPGYVAALAAEAGEWSIVPWRKRGSEDAT